MRYRRGIAVSLVIAIGLMLSGLLAGWLLPVVRLPEPTGPYAVGLVDRELVDRERGRRLMVSVWYPSRERGAAAPLTHYPDAVAAALGNLSGLPALPLQHLRYFTVEASEGVPAAMNDAPFPILVFSHGMVGLRLQNSATLQQLASWGYVVVALDHTDTAAVTVFPDGEARFYDLERFGIPDSVEPDQALMTEHVLPVWVADQQFVYDTLETWQTTDALLAGKLDLTRIGSFGHSFGGAVSLEVCRVDDRCKAAVNMDGALYGDIMTEAATQPLMLMTSADSRQYTETVEAWTSMIDNAAGPAYWLELPGSNHYSFTITPLLSPLLAPENFDSRVGLSTIEKYLRFFFDAYLRDVEFVPFGSASGDADVRWLYQENDPS